MDHLEDRIGIDSSHTLTERFRLQLGIADTTDLGKYIDQSLQTSDDSVKNYLKNRIGIADTTDLGKYIDQSLQTSDDSVKNYLKNRIGIADSINLQQYVDKQVVKVVRDSFESIQNTLAIILRRLPDSTSKTDTIGTGPTSTQ